MARGQLDTVLEHIRKLANLQEARDRSDSQLLHEFSTAQDQAAFAALVQRHGPMVLSVCGHVLQHTQDAEDAFQATFMVLAKKAATVRKREALASWLHGVAYRMAMQAKRDAARRRLHEGQVATRTPANPAWETAWHEVQAVLDAEIQRLPEKYRAPFVLCFLEGYSRAEAARELGVKEGTVWSRLAEARRRLQERLTRRGITLSAVLGAMAVAEGARAAAPALLRQATVQAAMRYAAGTTAMAAAGSAKVAALVEGVSKAMVVGKVKLVLAVALAAGVAAGTGLLAQPGRTDRPGAAQEQERQPATAAAGEKQGAGSEKRARVDQFGDPLPAEALARLGTVRFRHDDQLAYDSSITFAPDAKSLFSHGRNGIREWDAATGKQLSRFPRELEESLNLCALSPDATLVAGIDRNTGSLRIWKFATGRQVHDFGQSRCSFFCFSPDGKTLVAFGHHSHAELWELTTGRRLHSWKADESRVWTALFSRDGKTLITGGTDKAIRFWDVATGKQTREILGNPNEVGKLALSPDGKMLASIGWNEKRLGRGGWHEPDNYIRLWEVASGKEVRRVEGPARVSGPLEGFSAVSFAPDSKSLVTAGPDHILRFWDPATGKEQRRLALNAGIVWALAFSQDGRILAATAGARTIRLIDVTTGKVLVSADGHEQEITAMALSRDGRTLVTATPGPLQILPKGERAMIVWDPAAGRERFRLEGHEGCVTGLSMSDDGRALFSTASDNTLRLWDLATGKERRRLTVAAPSSIPSLLAVSADGKTAALALTDRSVVLLDTATGKEVHRLTGYEPWVCGAAFSRDRRILAVWSGDHAVHVWDLANNRKLRQFPFFQVFADEATRPPYSTSVSPDSALIAYANQLNRYLMVKELVTGKEIRRLIDLPDGVSALAFSTDGKMLAWSGEKTRAIHVAEVATGRERHVFASAQSRVHSLVFSIDGKTLISGNDDTTALVWDLAGRSGGSGVSAEALSAVELDAAWADLAGEDAARAYHAIWKLAGVAVQAVSYLSKHIKPAPPADEQRFARLISDLDSDEFAVRDSAAKELDTAGEAAVSTYRKALEGEPSLEVRRRVEALLQKRLDEWKNPSPERLRVLRAVEVLERIGTAEARAVLQTIARGTAEARLSEEANGALERLGRRGERLR